MVDVMNKVGFDYVCFGNHESDIPHADLLKRIEQSKFVWINSNMPNLPMGKLDPLPSYATVTVSPSDDDKKTRLPPKVVRLLGLNTNNPGLYRKDAWGGLGASCIEPIVESAKEWVDKLRDSDLIIPMTHQEMHEDRKFAELRLPFPLILGGHDHQLYHEDIAGATILKLGADAVTIGVIDIDWKVGEDCPSISVQKLPAVSFPRDPTICACIEKHNQVLKSLDDARLCRIPKGMQLSSKTIRLQQTSMGTLIASSLTSALFADCAMINAGNIRGNAIYNGDALTYSDIKAEMPFDSVVVVLELPGRVISDSVSFTRARSLLSPPQEMGMYLQVDRGTKVRLVDEKYVVTHIADRPMEPEKLYKCVCLFQVAIDGIDNVAPLADFCRVGVAAGTMPNCAEAGRPAKEVLVDYFARSVWWDIVHKFGFQGLDVNGDGLITREEMSRVLDDEYGELVLNNLFQVADIDNDDCISPKELLSVSTLSMSLFMSSIGDGTDSLTRCDVERIVADLFNNIGEKERTLLVDEWIGCVDGDGDGVITLEELIAAADVHSTTVSI